MSNKIELNCPAPDFVLADFNGNEVKLSEYQGKTVLLVFNRGFVWPFCQAHMAQLRQDYQEYVSRNTEIIVIGPENASEFKKYWRDNQLPFTGLPDPKHTVLKKYGQEVNLFKLGRMPAQVVVDQNGTARYVHYGKSMMDIPSNEEILQIIDEINQRQESIKMGSA